MVLWVLLSMHFLLFFSFIFNLLREERGDLIKQKLQACVSLYGGHACWQRGS